MANADGNRSHSQYLDHRNQISESVEKEVEDKYSAITGLAKKESIPDAA